MQYSLYRLTLAFAFFVAFSGCKKENPPPLTSDGFVQFKIQTGERRYDDYNQDAGDITAKVSPKAFTINFTSDITRTSTHLLAFQFNSNAPLETKTYTLNSKNKNETVSFVTTERDLTNYAYYPSAPRGAQYPSSGVIELTRIDTASGGLIEGKFSFTNLYERDRNNIILNYYKNLTAGTFSVRVQ